MYLFCIIASISCLKNFDVVRIYDDEKLSLKENNIKEDDSEVNNNKDYHETSSYGYLEVYSQQLFSSAWKRICPDGWNRLHTHLVCSIKGFVDGTTIQQHLDTKMESKRTMLKLVKDCDLSVEGLQSCFNSATPEECSTGMAVYIVCHSYSVSSPSTRTSCCDDNRSISWEGRMQSEMTNTFSFIESNLGYIPLLVNFLEDNSTISEIPVCHSSWEVPSMTNSFCISLGFDEGMMTSTNDGNQTAEVKNRLGKEYCSEIVNTICKEVIEDCNPVIIDCYITISERVTDDESNIEITFLEEKYFLFKVFIDLEVEFDIQLSLYVPERVEGPSYLGAEQNKITINTTTDCAGNNNETFGRVDAATITTKESHVELESCNKLTVLFFMEKLSREPNRTFGLHMRATTAKKRGDLGFWATIYGAITISVVIIIVMVFSIYMVSDFKKHKADSTSHYENN